MQENFKLVNAQKLTEKRCSQMKERLLNQQNEFTTKIHSFKDTELNFAIKEMTSEF